MEYNHKIDSVKFWCVTAVILIHLTAFIPQNGIATVGNYYIYRYFFDIAVPFFFATSGYLLAHKDVGYLRIYAKKVFIIYIFFSFFYLFVRLGFIFSDKLFIGTAFWANVKSVIEGITIQNLYKGVFGSFHLWFLTALFLGTILLLVTLHYNLRAFTIFLIAFFIYTTKMAYKIGLGDFISNGGFPLAFFYLSIGYYVAKNDIRIKYPLLFFVIMFIMYALNRIYIHAGINTLLLALTTFFLIVYCKEYPGKKSIFSKLGKHSLSIYILHVFVYGIIYRILKYNGITAYRDSAWKILIVTILCVIFSIVLFKPLDVILKKSIKVLDGAFK